MKKMWYIIFKFTADLVDGDWPEHTVLSPLFVVTNRLLEF